MIDYELAEQAVLSSMLHDESGLATAQAGEALTKADFSTTDRSTIFETCLRLSPCNEIDLIIEKVDWVLTVGKQVKLCKPKEICEHFAKGLYHNPLIDSDCS